MKKGLLVAVVLAVVLLLSQLSVQALAGFQESRWQIMDLLAYPEKIQQGLTQDYSVSKASWERNDLNDGTPRWLAEAKIIYTYELMGSPIKSVTFTGGLTNDEDQGYELATRAMLFMRALGLSKEKTIEVLQTVLNAALANEGTKYYIVSQGIRVEMTFFKVMSMLMLTLSKD